ncbi:MAG TPA: efflux RND transporter periplasmic adaptor subunit [Cyclobacteriaceae bacterium]|nr:efflux RND transporter periplasmic adaptor subunit [Cyclobacteriaceae bacterium]
MNPLIIFSNPIIRTFLFLIAGFLAGWIVFHKPQSEAEPETMVNEAEKTVWTCAMHPQIRRDQPGQCPICGMDLIPLVQETAPVDPDAVVMSEEAAKLAQLQTSIVTGMTPEKEVRLYGKIQADERLVQTQPAHIPGRIEQLMVNFTGEEVRKGQLIAQIYSPALITAQQELLEALKMDDTTILEASRYKLRQWKLADDQIAEIEDSRQVKTVFDVYSTVSGIITSRLVNKGDYVQLGTPLYEIADLSRVWVMFDAYESDLPWIKRGDRISFNAQALPGRDFSGRVSFIDPVINSQTRVARVRMEITNHGNLFKPEMFVTGYVKTRLAAGRNSLIIPQSAVLWTGTRSVVYVKVPETSQPAFSMREITIGPVTSEGYIVTDGLTAGEEIVTNGTFSVDASAQLTGKPSMMNPSGGKVSTGHVHEAMGDNDKKMETSGSGHEGHDLPGKSASSGMDVKADIRFQEQLTDVYEDYLKIKDALVSGDLPGSLASAAEMNSSLGKVDMSLVKGENHNHWMELSSKIKNSLDVFRKGNSIEAVRKSFMEMSDVLTNAVKMFGLSDKTVYYQFCPMANDNKGAYWLSQTADIRNPYFGAQMLTCGETKAILK